MEQIIPLISSGVAGPLGVLHLPRLWLKASLAHAGKLHPDYPALAPGYDTMVLDGLGINHQAFKSFIESQPSYIECERWIVENGSKVTPEAIAELNEAILGYEHADDIRQNILGKAGLPDGMPRDAVNLNNLDDWDEFHAAVLS
ncbi:MAG: DUF5069 domain-containing protein [Verrucomicrobiales bacterium]